MDLIFSDFNGPTRGVLQNDKRPNLRLFFFWGGGGALIKRGLSVRRLKQTMIQPALALTTMIQPAPA